MMAFVRNALGGRPLPANFAGGAIETENEELVEIGRRACLPFEALVGLGQFVRGRDSVRLSGREDKNPVAPDDGTCTAAPG
jgi:hypothetical protein